MKNDKARVVILCSKQDVLLYREKHQKLNDILFAIGVDALYYCTKYNLKFEELEFQWKSIDYNLALKESESKIDQLIFDLNEYSKLKYSSLEIGSYYAFNLWVIIGQIHYNYFIAHSILNSIKPKELLLFKNRSFGQIFKYRPNPAELMIQIFLNSNLINKDKITVIDIKEFQILNHKELVKKIIPNFVYNTYVNLKAGYKNSNFSFSKKNLLQIGPAYDWKNIFNYSKFRKSFNIFLLIPEYKIYKHLTDDYINIDGIVNKYLTYNGCIIFDLSNLTKNIATDLYNFHISNKKYNKIILKYDAVVGSVFTNPFESFIAHMAILEKKPVILWQHGEKGQTYDVTIPYTELYFATHYFTYGKSVTEMYKNYEGKWNFINPITIGSLQKNCINLSNDYIVYATGKWHKTATPFCDFPNPDRRLFEAQFQILTFFNNLKNEKTIFKVNNTPNFNNIPYEFNNIIIDDKSKFTDLIKFAKIIVLDTPTTTLIEACSTSLPIFVLGGRAIYKDTFLIDIKKRVVWCESICELLNQIQSYLSSGYYKANLNDKTYINNFCFCNQSESIVDNVIDNLNMIIKNYNI